MSKLHFAEYDANELEAGAIERLEKALGVGFGDGDERIIFLRQIIQIIVGVLASIDDAAGQNLLRYARGQVLNAIGEDRGVIRLPATPAKTIIDFTLSAPRSKNVIIPKGTRVTADGKLVFYTVDLLTIPAGKLFASVGAFCNVSGVIGNGIQPGMIKTLVDPIPYVASAANIITTSGGADEELDDPYRERIRQSPERYTTTGTEDSYVYWAMTASPAIQDVKVTMPSPGRVHLTVLAPGEDEATIITDVERICASAKRRTFTDYVTVGGPQIVPFDIDVTYHIRAGEEAKVIAAIEDSGGAIEQYIKWQSEKLGREINPDYLNMLLMQAGAFKVDIRAPIRGTVTPVQVARLESCTVSYEVTPWI